MTVLQRCIRWRMAGALALTLTHSARASEPEQVWLELPECSQPPYDAAQLTSSLALELRPHRLASAPRAGAPASGTHLRILLRSCDGRADSLLLRWEAAGAPARQRELSLRDVPWPARARTLALLISEVLRPPRWEQVEPSASAAPPATQSPPASALAPLSADPLFDGGLLQRSDPYSPPYHFFAGGGVQASWIPRVGALLYGVRMAMNGRVLGPAEWALEGSFAGGRNSVGSERYDMKWWSAAAGIDYNLGPARAVQLGPRLSVAHVDGYSGHYASDADIDASLALLGARVMLRPGMRSERVGLELLLDASYPLLTLESRDAESKLPWTAWVVTMGAGLTIEL